MIEDPNGPRVVDPKTFAIIGAAFDVHRELGSGFSEPVYREGLTNELLRRRIPFAREVNLPVYYKGDLLPLHYRADFVCYDDVLVELKAIPAVGPREYGQLRNYLRVGKLQRGLLLNFGAQSLQYRRVDLREKKREI